LLVLDKPGGITSRTAVDHAQRWFPRGTRIGHTGTLDPLATGVLVLCLGQATRLAEYVQRMGKTYRTTLFLGATSDTDDADGTVTPTANATAPTRAVLENALVRFHGEIAQTPPAYSAAKVGGRRAYDLARQGKVISLAPRTVRIDAIRVLDYSFPRLELEIDCGKGTYIRALARDLGEQLGVGAFVAALRRTRVGPFCPEQAVPWSADSSTARSRILDSRLAVADLPTVRLTEDEARRLGRGQAVPLPSGRAGVADAELAILTPAGELLAIGKWQSRTRLLQAERVVQSGG
jgi:tRNA pseudouridine55 synthase